MAGQRQTSVRVSPRALDALKDVARARGVSRDEAVRQLLDEYIDAQSRLPEESRLTHVSTLLRYPPEPMPREAGDGRIRLAPRLEEGTAQLAAALSFRLPGQPVKRGPGQYSPRPLTDAIVSAIAMRRPFVDEGLEGLPPLVTHRVALGVWRLTVAATLTNAEQQELFSAGSEAAVVLREEDVAWHERWRFDVALHLCRRLLTGPGAAVGHQLLTEQGEDFRTLVFDLERTTDQDHELVRGARPAVTNVAGRGGAAVWRAHRAVALTNLGASLATSGGSVRAQVTPPGWHLSAPPRWGAHRYRHGQPLTGADREDLDAGRVVLVQAGSRSALWPYGPGGVPIDGFDTVVDAAGGIDATRLVEVCLARAGTLLGVPMVPADKAFEFGFIDAAERDQLLKRAADDRRGIVEHAARRRRSPLTSEQVEAMLAAVESPDRFALLARRLRVRQTPRPAAVAWDVESLATVVDHGGVTPAQLRWLTREMRRLVDRALEADMERAWHAAFQAPLATVVDGM